MKLLPDLSWCPRALLLYPAAAAAEDKALRGRNPSAACSGYTAGRVAAKQPDWSVPAGILRKRKIHSKYRSNHSDQDSSGAANHFLPNKPTNKKPKIPRFHCPQFRVKYNEPLSVRQLGSTPPERSKDLGGVEIGSERSRRIVF